MDLAKDLEVLVRALIHAGEVHTLSRIKWCRNFGTAHRRSMHRTRRAVNGAYRGSEARSTNGRTKQGGPMVQRSTGVDRQTVDLSGFPDLVVIYLGMRVRTVGG